LSQTAIDAVIPRMLEGKALRPIAYQVIAMSGNPNVDAHMVAQVVRSDMEMSAKIIAAASSVFYRRRNASVRNLTDAIGVIGLNGTRNLAMSLAVVDHFGPNCDDPLLAMPKLWGHSLSVAQLAECLAKATHACDPDEAFVVGLLHDLGRMLMAEHLRAHYSHVVHSDPSTNMSLHEIERRIVGADHTHFGGIVTERWGCPSFISRAVKMHHSQSIQTDEGDDGLGGLLRILLLADSMAIAFGYAGDELEELSAVPRGWLSKAIENPLEFRDTSLDTLREAQAMVMSRSNLTIDLPTPWIGDFVQILVMGTVVQPLEPLQLLVSHAFHDAQLVAPARVDRSIQKTLVLADLRGVSKDNDAASPLNWLNREKAPENWPVLLVSRLGADQIAQLGLNGRRFAAAKPPLRPILLRAAVESLATTAGASYNVAA
jgi:putative nucleotidyltransferase with HDIG domain